MVRIKCNWFAIFLFTCLVGEVSVHGQQTMDTELSNEEYRELRKEVLNQDRPIIHNNDGCDAVYFPINESYSLSNFLDKRSSGLIGTDVKTLSYCTIASGFGNFTHRTKVGEELTDHGFNYGLRDDARNITAEMFAHGTDPLKATVEFAHEHGFEVFWSNRMNDTHDAAHKRDQKFYLWTEFKEKHPEYLFGEIGEHLPNGRWSSLDFSNKEVRDLCVEFYREVCENYDVDGVELDFFRHLELFGNVGRGGVATKEQVHLITEMVKRIRMVTEEIGRKRGKPILVLTRIPTNPEYALKVGIDIKSWISEELVDIVVGSGYFRLDFWENFAKLGLSNSVKIYAGFSESRVKDEHPFLIRQQNAVFRARAAAAWSAGIDGIYVFNQYNTRVKFLSEIGDPEKLKTTNNLYFVTYRDYTADRYLKGGNDYFSTSRISPTSGNHRKLGSGPIDFRIEIGDESQSAEVFLPVWTKNINPNDLHVKINGKRASLVTSEENGLVIFELNQNHLKSGINEMTMDYVGAKKDDIWIKDAAVFFCRDKSDLELRDLINVCISD